MVPTSLDLLEPLVEAGGIEILFTHFNHSNPVLDPASEEAAEIGQRGFGIATDGLEIGL